MKKDMNRMLVETVVRRTLKNIQSSPERETRNLVDLGLECSKGRFQKNFLRTTQKMLHNQESAYYSLVKNTVDTVDHDILTTFGINLGYNGCTKGARVIREVEAEHGFNVPWSLTIAINEVKLDAEPDFYPSVLQQGISLGIHTFLFFITGDPEKVLPLMQKQPECAFILFLRGHSLSSSFVKKMKAVKNVMTLVYANEDMPDACQKLKDAKLLYGVYERYTEQDKERILSGEWLNTVLPAKPTFAVLRADYPCTPETKKDVYDYVVSVRDSQKYPLILVDLKHDILAIDRMISEEECIVGFNADGGLQTYEGYHREEQFNIFSHTLEDILRAIADELKDGTDTVAQVDNR